MRSNETRGTASSEAPVHQRRDVIRRSGDSAVEVEPTPEPDGSVVFIGFNGWLTTEQPSLFQYTTRRCPDLTI